MTRAAIKHAEGELRAAMLAADVDALDDLLDDELVFIGPTGELARKADDLESYRSGDRTISSHQPRGLVVVLHGDDIAVATVVVDLEGTLRGQAFSGSYRYIRTWRRGPAGTWRILAGAVAAIARA